MNKLNDGDVEIQEQIRTVQVFYHTKYPTATMDIRYESIKALIEFCNSDIKYIEKAINELPAKTSDGTVPGFGYVSKVVKDKYRKKVDPKPTLSEQEILAKCEFTAHQKMMIDLSSARVTDYIPEEELPFTGFSDPNLRKMIDGWFEDGKIDEYYHNHAIKGIKILTTEWKEIGKQIKTY